jgi:methylmalonyl-CoA mutase
MARTAEALTHGTRRQTPVRVVSAAALFDGHDAAINIVRRLLQAHGAEVIHLGHDRAVEDVFTAALQEDVDAIAISSYQGGHLEYFKYLVDRLRDAGAGHVRVYGGGGGVITADEIAALQEYGVARIYSPEDGQRLGLDGMIAQIIEDCAEQPERHPAQDLARLGVEEPGSVARLISWLEGQRGEPSQQLLDVRAELETRAGESRAPVIGFTGTGGAGKSSLIDEIIRRQKRARPEQCVGLVLVDPSRRRSGGALLGDRLRLNSIDPSRVFVRSLATRQAHRALSVAVADAVRVMQAAGYDLILVETAGIGQSDSEIIDLVDVSLYVMTPEYGAALQLEKIDMLELADLVVLNKFDRRGGEDALRDVRKQWRRNHVEFELPDDQLPVFPTMASRFDDPGTDRLFDALGSALAERGFAGYERRLVSGPLPPRPQPLVPEQRSRYLAEIAEALRAHRRAAEEGAEHARDAQALARTRRLLGDAAPGESLQERLEEALGALDPKLREALEGWPETRDRYGQRTQSYTVRDREIEVENHGESLAGLPIPRVALPRGDDWGELYRYLALENLPGSFPYTAGVFPFKRTGEEDPTRMFAGEGTPERTNQRFHLLARNQAATRLSTAFDSVTLYGRDPVERPDVWGKVGTSGVSVCTVDDAKRLYSGFDLLAPSTSVSMTINGPAPVMLACFLNAAIDQRVETHLRESGQWGRVEELRAAHRLPEYRGELPEGHDGRGLGLLGISGDELVDAETYARIKADVLRRVRGTVQADILKEDQAQNTCIFSIEFALRMMGDIQEYFCQNDVQNFYSVSISGYHMAEAGANPVSQLAFTLANGFTYCEYYLARGLDIDAFAPSLSFFFSNGLDPEYSVIGRVARRIWAVALRDHYAGGELSQRLKYHIQTSGRSLHAQEMGFNDIRTTLQAVLALADHCNSLHTNAYDEALTTPTAESVRKAVAIQLVLSREFGPLKNENPAQGAYLTQILTDLVEDAVLEEFDRISERGGVLGAMETMYQRGKIQDESLHYEQLKHSGELPIVGVNTFLNPNPEQSTGPSELVRGTEEERRSQLEDLQAFQDRHAERRPAALQRLQEAALRGENTFEILMETVKVASLGQIVDALFRVGGEYRRAM